jgi:HEAT repeat protein
MTEIEIRDPDTAVTSEPAPDSPYKNLLVPLVVVPALIVMVLVLIFVLFGAVTGKENSPRENLDRLLNGGYNERKQAAFNLVRQVLDHRKGALEGAVASSDGIDASFLPDLRAARERVDELRSPKDVPIPLVLSSLLAQLGEPEGVEQLAEMTRLDEVLDPEHEYRVYAAMTLGAIGSELPPSSREQAARALIALLENPDPALVLVAIAGLQTLPSPVTVPALRGMLTSRSLDQRASAALSLAVLGERAGESVLIEMLALAPYEAERAADARRWPPQRVSESRCKALEALAVLGGGPSRAELEALAAADNDPKVRATVARILEAPTPR